MRSIKLFFRATIFFACALWALGAQAAMKLGVDYSVIPKPIASESPGKIEIEEFFWYRCPHCKDAQPYVDAWRSTLAKDVSFRPIHVMYPGRSDLEGHAKLYLALKAIGALDALQDKVFEATFDKKLELRDEATLVKWLPAQGVSVDKFMGFYKSFGISAQVAQLQAMCVDNEISKTPTFIVGGKYKVNIKEGLSVTDGFKDLFDRIEQLTAMIRQEQAGKKKK